MTAFRIVHLSLRRIQFFVQNCRLVWMRNTKFVSCSNRTLSLILKQDPNCFPLKIIRGFTFVGNAFVRTSLNFFIISSPCNPLYGKQIYGLYISSLLLAFLVPGTVELFTTVGKPGATCGTSLTAVNFFRTSFTTLLTTLLGYPFICMNTFFRNVISLFRYSSVEHIINARRSKPLSVPTFHARGAKDSQFK